MTDVPLTPQDERVIERAARLLLYHTLGAHPVALLLAHAVDANGALTLVAGEVGKGDRVVLATGKVTHRLEITRVAGIGDKFASARTYLDSWLDAGARVIADVPEANDADVPSEFRMYCRNGNCLSLVGSADVDAVLSRLEIFDRLMKAERGMGRESPEPAAIASAPTSVSKSPRPLRWIGAAAVLCLVAILARETPVPNMVRDAIDTGRAIGVELVGDALRLVESDVGPPTPDVHANRDGQANGVSAGEELSAAMELPRGGEPDKSNASAPERSVRNHVATAAGETPVARPSAVATADVGDMNTATGQWAEPEGARSGFLVLPIDGAGGVPSNTRSIQRAADRVEQALIDAGHEVLLRSSLGLELRPGTLQRQLLELTQNTSASVAVLLKLIADKRETRSLDRMHVRLEVEMVDIRNGVRLAQSAIPTLGRRRSKDDWVVISKRCNEQCEDEAIGNVAEKLANDVATMLLKQFANREAVYTLTIVMRRDYRR